MLAPESMPEPEPEPEALPEPPQPERRVPRSAPIKVAMTAPEPRPAEPPPKLAPAKPKPAPVKPRSSAQPRPRDPFPRLEPAALEEPEPQRTVAPELAAPLRPEPMRLAAVKAPEEPEASTAAPIRVARARRASPKLPVAALPLDPLRGPDPPAPAPGPRGPTRSDARLRRSRSAPRQPPKVSLPAAAGPSEAPARPLPSRASRNTPTAGEQPVSVPELSLAQASSPRSKPRSATPIRVAAIPESPPSEAASSEAQPELRGVPLGSLAACVSDAEEDRWKRRVLAQVGSRNRCSSRAGQYRFVETKNLNAFLIWVERAPGRDEVDRCAELALALDCLAQGERR